MHDQVFRGNEDLPASGMDCDLWLHIPYITQADPAQLTAQPVGLSSGTGKFFSVSIYTSKGYKEIFFMAVENETNLLPPG